MKRERYKWHFQRFLIEHKVYKAFIDNVESTDNSFKEKHRIVSVKYLLNNLSQREWITNAFDWSETTQGDAFWRNLYFEWESTLNDLEKL